MDSILERCSGYKPPRTTYRSRSANGYDLRTITFIGLLFQVILCKPMILVLSSDLNHY
jgi:hypothetical protein